MMSIEWKGKANELDNEGTLALQTIQKYSVIISKYTGNRKQFNVIANYL